jgi:hypothetical protein
VYYSFYLLLKGYAMTGLNITLATAKKLARSMGYSLSKKDGEYRMRPLSAKPFDDSMTHYTDDLADALQTAEFEYRRSLNAMAC